MEKILPFGIIVVSGLVRVILSAFPFNPLLAAVNYSFVSIKNKYLSALTVLLLHFITDIIINLIMGYQLFGLYMIINYTIDQINGQISRYMVKKEDQVANITVCAVLTSFNFWFLSNLGVFFSSGEFTAKSLTKTFTDAVPFFKYNFFSMVLFTIAIYGTHNLITYLYNIRRDSKDRVDIEKTAPFMQSVNSLEI